ncbi:hypothetical protein Tco_0925653 [Tanacetum coccineum]|uniref:Uncharacterized protein n=1 Tax=Tanacetum coccineum TaxID=301880 RepID=A0ABQ5DDL5_9ASTR
MEPQNLSHHDQGFLVEQTLKPPQASRDMSDTDEERPRKYRKLSDVYKQEYERIRGVANLLNDDSESNSPEDDSDEFSLKKHSRKSKAKSVAPERSGSKRRPSTSGTKKVSLSRGSKKGTEMAPKEMPKNLRLQLGGHNRHITEKKQLLSICTWGEKALGLISLSNGPPASGPGLPQSEPIEPETSVCVTNRNPSEFSSEVAKNYMRSC